MTASNLNIIRKLSSDVVEKADVCIIGTGAAGSVLAYELSKKDKKVVMLEKGDYYDINCISGLSEEKLLNLWKNKGVFTSRSLSVNIAQGECVGGSTMINYGICFKIPEAVFSFWKHAFGVTITRAELNDAIERVDRQLKMRTISDAGRCHELFEEGCKALGYRSGWMNKAYVPGGGKQNALVAFLNESNVEKVKIYARCKADKIFVSGKRAYMVKGIHYNPTTKEWRTVTVESDKVIVSAGPIASSEILLRNNIANSNDQVGKHLSLHPSSSVIAEFDKKVDGDQGMAMAYYCDEFSVLKTGKAGFMIESVFVPPSQLSIMMPAFGKENEDYLKKYDYYAMAGVMVHDEPSGTVSLNWNNDAVVDYSLSDADQAKMIDGLKEAARIFFRARAKCIITGHTKKTILRNLGDLKLIDKRGAGIGALLVQSAHPQGGNRMGEDRANSVVNSYCQSHEIKNLYVCDASVFPTSLGVNPQLTVMTLATLTADHINQYLE